jgi:superfamily II DNA or RNA helicase
MTDLLLHRDKQLRPHQVKAIDVLRDSLRSGHRTPLLQGPTGFGKTLVSYQPRCPE